MEHLMAKIDGAAAVLGGLCGWFFGGFDGFFYALIAFTTIDYISGVMAAWERKELSSAVGFRGIRRKVMIFALVGIAHVIDAEFFGHGDVLRDAVAFFYLANEGLSILENAVEIGVPAPEFLKEKLMQIHGGAEKEKAKD